VEWYQYVRGRSACHHEMTECTRSGMPSSDDTALPMRARIHPHNPKLAAAMWRTARTISVPGGRLGSEPTLGTRKHVRAATSGARFRSLHPANSDKLSFLQSLSESGN